MRKNKDKNPPVAEMPLEITDQEDFWMGSKVI